MEVEKQLRRIYRDPADPGFLSEIDRVCADQNNLKCMELIIL